MKFKVGDRVRINLPGYPLHGREGVIWKISNEGWVNELHPHDVAAHWVDVDGHGRGALYVPWANLGFSHWELEPLVSPDELAWQQFKTYLQPNHAILPPIVTTSDEEAARIAETTPGSVINVVHRGVVVSTYWGKPW